MHDSLTLDRIPEATEEEMREHAAIWPESEEELLEYIRALLTKTHSYGTAAYAMAYAATAAFNYVAKMEGCTDFQVGCADMDILRQTRGMDCGFLIVDYSKFLYPQYEYHTRLKLSSGTFKVLREKAKERLLEAVQTLDITSENVGPTDSVFQHLWRIATGHPPYGLEVEPDPDKEENDDREEE